MSSIDALLNERTKTKEIAPKTGALAHRTAGDLTQVFIPVKLEENEKKSLENLLLEFSEKTDAVDEATQSTFRNDVEGLIALTGEIRAISNQSILLHGERIKRAQSILLRYQSGAFTSWLTAAYGNRQTPYNFLSYYELYQQTPENLREKFTSMPRHAIYMLATREGATEKKHVIINDFRGESKLELICKISDEFPIPEHDKRKSGLGDQVGRKLQEAINLLQIQKEMLTKSQKMKLTIMLETILSLVTQGFISERKG